MKVDSVSESTSHRRDNYHKLFKRFLIATPNAAKLRSASEGEGKKDLKAATQAVKLDKRTYLAERRAHRMTEVFLRRGLKCDLSGDCEIAEKSYKRALNCLAKNDLNGSLLYHPAEVVVMLAQSRVK